MLGFGSQLHTNEYWNYTWVVEGQKKLCRTNLIPWKRAICYGRLRKKHYFRSTTNKPLSHEERHILYVSVDLHNVAWALATTIYKKMKFLSNFLRIYTTLNIGNQWRTQNPDRYSWRTIQNLKKNIPRIIIISKLLRETSIRSCCLQTKNCIVDNRQKKQFSSPHQCPNTMRGYWLRNITKTSNKITC